MLKGIKSIKRIAHLKELMLCLSIKCLQIMLAVILVSTICMTRVCGREAAFLSHKDQSSEIDDIVVWKMR